MPDDVDTLARAERENWDAARIARKMEIPEDPVAGYQRAYRNAKAIVDAPSPAEAFRRGVGVSIKRALEEGLNDEGAVERLVTQIGYRAADLGFLLDMEGKRLSEYSEELRHETEYDAQYHRERFEEMRRRWDEEKRKSEGGSG